MKTLLFIAISMVVVDTQYCEASPELKPLDWHTLSILHESALVTHRIALRKAETELERPRRSTWLPDLRFRYGHGLDDVYRASIDNATSDTLSTIDSSARNGSEHRFEIEVRWQLAHLVFHPSESRLRAQQQRIRNQGNDIKTQVTDAYINWSNGVIALNSVDTIPALQKARQSIKRWTLILNALTGGRLAQALSEARGL